MSNITMERKLWNEKQIKANSGKTDENQRREKERNLKEKSIKFKDNQIYTFPSNGAKSHSLNSQCSYRTYLSLSFTGPIIYDSFHHFQKAWTQSCRLCRTRTVCRLCRICRMYDMHDMYDMYVYVCTIYIYTYIHICTYTNIHTYLHTHAYEQTSTEIQEVHHTQQSPLCTFSVSPCPISEWFNPP